AMLEAVSEDDIRAAVGQLTELARAGKMEAIRLLLAYTLGKPGRPLDHAGADDQQEPVSDNGTAPHAAPAAKEPAPPAGRKRRRAPGGPGGAAPLVRGRGPSQREHDLLSGRERLHELTGCGKSDLDAAADRLARLLVAEPTAALLTTPVPAAKRGP